MHSDRIIISNLVLHGHHGVFSEEKQLGQKFHVDIECSLALADSGLQDDYSKTVCYARLCEIAAKVSNEGPYKLIEALAEKIAQQILEKFSRINEVRVQVRKPSAPVSAVIDHVAIEVRRQREHTFTLSLGSNISQKSANITTALTLIGSEDKISIERISPQYHTKPWGNENQESFINACALGKTSLSVKQLLRLCKDIELRMGRLPNERWGPRLIDIDILTFGDLRLCLPEITLPHPELFNRLFVLKPLADIAPNMAIEGQKVRDALAQLKKQAGKEGASTAPARS